MFPKPHDQQLLSCSDPDLAHFILESPRHPSSSRLTLLSPGLVAKLCLPGNMEDEVKAISVARQLGIRVPHIKRTIETRDDGYIILERINGIILEELWPRIGWIMTIRLAFQLRYSVQRLRSLTSSTAGSLCSGECRSFWLDDRYNLPAHSTPGAIVSFIEFWNNFTPLSRRRQSSEPTRSCNQNYLPPTPTSLIFTHHDLAPRNILIDNCGRLWLLDWEYSGWYPIYFEYASMQNFILPRNWGWLAQLRWKLFSWISVGMYSSERDVLARIRTKFTRFPVGRRNEVLHNKAPARYSALEYKYKAVESLTPSDELTEPDHYIFVVRTRIDKETKNQIHYIDVKSPGLRDVLRKVLQDTPGTCLREVKPSNNKHLKAISKKSKLDHETPTSNIVSLRHQHLITSVTFVLLLYLTRATWVPHLPALPSTFALPFRYTRLPSSFSSDIENGLSSSSFNLHTNVAAGDTRQGLDDGSKLKIQQIMKRKNVGFDEARRLFMQERFKKADIDETGRPRDPKFVSFS
ncbi:hypothetical protein B7494_g1859 [Chlorociboria aeruginascens]|nr:hypothetical protein B7494_g1859 [Chlorociboria aeruginascens]